MRGSSFKPDYYLFIVLCLFILFKSVSINILAAVALVKLMAKLYISLLVISISDYKDLIVC